MPEFEIVSLKEAQLRTIPGRQGRYLNEYVDYITQLPHGQAGRLHVVESENPLTIRRRLAVAAQMLGINLIIKRSGSDVYFWSEGNGAAQPRRGRPRRGRAGDHFPPQSFGEPEEVRLSEGNEHGATEEASPELGQTPA
jgi:hypothetical protein